VAQAAVQGKDVARVTTQGAGAVVQEAGTQVGQVVEEAKVQARNALEDAKSQLRDHADAQATKISDGLRSLSNEMRALSEGRPEAAGTAKQYLEQATSKLDGAVSRLDAGGLEGVLNDVQRYARRRPVMFLAGAAAAGFLAGRLFRSVKDEGDAGDRPALSAPASGAPELDHSIGQTRELSVPGLSRG
jgi:ElaB/YqjD/DUF883 family membrane-anchored ribosome-binding protein